MLEFGFTVHSIFIGLAVGMATQNFVQLFIALMFHQFFEGVGLGSRLAEPKLDMSNWNMFFLAFIFAISAPIGIIIGTSLVTSINPNSPTFMLTEGVLDAFCAGILIYVGFILLFKDFPRDTEIVAVGRYKRLKRFSMYFSLWSGASLMSGLGKFL